MTAQPSSGTRRKVLLVVVLITVGIGAGALVAMRFVKSPAQVAAEASAPPAGPVTIAVERKVMRSTVVTRGQVDAATSVEIRAMAAREGGKPLVTRLPAKVGDTVRAGQVVAEVSGRPVIVLPGEVPAYRDLRPSADGADVRQLQAALIALGHGIGSDAKGFYGPGTKAAVTATYAAAGYQAPTTGKDDAQLVLAAQRRVRDANAAVDRLSRDPAADGAAVADARQAAADATQDLADLVLHTGAMVPLGELVFVPSLPARVASIGAAVGSDAPDKLVTLAVGDLVVRGPLSRVDATLVRAGQPVEIVSEILGVTAQGTVAAVGPPPARASAPDSEQGKANNPNRPRVSWS